MRGWTAFVALALMITFIIFNQVQGCEGDREHARKIVKNYGFDEVRVDGPKGYKCGGEGQSNEFTACNAQGCSTGVVCCSLFECQKNCTVRWD